MELITDREGTVIKIIFGLIGIIFFVVLGITERRRLTADIVEAEEESARLKSEIATLEAMNGAYEDYFNCVEIRARLGLDEVKSERRNKKSHNRPHQAG